MPISPNMAEDLAEPILRLYTEAEAVMIEKVARRIARGITETGWAEKKLAEVQALRREAEREVERLRRQTEQLVEEAVGQAHERGVRQAELDLAKLPEQQTGVAFGRVSERAVEAILRETVRNVESTHFRILRVAEDAYRSTVARAAAQVTAGTQTRLEAAQQALNRFADQGFAGFVDRSGRQWDLASYAEMSVRTASGRAAVQGHADRLQSGGRDLVIVSNSPDECPLCRPWEGKVLSLSGRTPGYPTLAEAQAAGLFHPGCTHSIAAFIPGLTQPMRGTANPEGYEERQQQRYNERQIRRWKRRAAAAITDEARELAGRKVREWQARQREFVAETDRRRRYERESITRAR